ncbi:MAG: hypothetical protein CME64_14525 [Halobacteriovoraceae bacterium]|nr:hypothetical protein [Halobacteriovoraceae bacterium]|tara:strand:+ start:105355 stop:106548 length:1194 start_codon:yes stop_codon:yes gene_type:complete
MKKQIAIAMGLAVISTSAFATKARLEALGEDQYGSQFISDNRNVFLNAATVNFHKDLVYMEFGSSDTTQNTVFEGVDLANAGALGGTNLTESTDQDTSATPKAEGGFFKASGNMVYGVVFGSESNTSNGLRTLAMGNEVVHESNNFDIFVGGDAGVQWGASFTYSDSKNEQFTAEDEQTAMRARLGVISGDLSGFANLNLQNNAESANEEFDGQAGYQVGGTYEMNDMYYMVQHRSFKGEDTDNNEISVDKTWLGAAKAYRLNDKSNVWLSAWYKTEKTENDFDAILATGETKTDFIPVTLAAEVSVKEWLTLRGSVGHTIWGTTENDSGDEATVTDTFVNAGASLIFGDFQVDGLIGNVTSNGSGANAAGSTSTDAGEGVLRTDALMSRVSLLYRF